MESHFDFVWISIITNYAECLFMCLLSIDTSFIYIYIYIYIFIYSFIYLFLAALGLSLVAASGAPLRCRAWASHCGGFSRCEAQAVGMQVSVAVAHGLSSCGSWALEHSLSSCGTRA